MSNIIDFPRRMRQKPQTQSTAQNIDGDTRTGHIPGVTQEAKIKFLKPPASPSEALEATLDAHRSTLLELAHRRQAFELQMILENNTAQIKLEAAAYRALVAGVPESDIYGLGEDMAEALSSAMETVAGA